MRSIQFERSIFFQPGAMIKGFEMIDRCVVFHFRDWQQNV